MKKPQARPTRSASRRPRKRASTVERAERALEEVSDRPPPSTDDPARDRSAIEDGALAPLDHAD